MPTLQRRDERRIVDERAPRSVDQQAATFHRGEGTGIVRRPFEAYMIASPSITTIAQAALEPCLDAQSTFLPVEAP